MHHVTLGRHPTNREHEKKKFKPSAYSMSEVSNFQCFVCVCVAYPMSLTKACFSPLSFFTKIRVLQAVIFLTAGDRNLTVHKR